MSGIETDRRRHRGESHRRLAAVIVVIIVVAGAVIALAVTHFSSDRKSGSVQLPTTGEYAPLTVPHAKLYYAGGVVVNEPEAGSESWVSASLSALAGMHRYLVRIDNTSNLDVLSMRTR